MQYDHPGRLPTDTERERAVMAINFAAVQIRHHVSQWSTYSGGHWWQCGCGWQTRRVWPADAPRVAAEIRELAEQHQREAESDGRDC